MNKPAASARPVLRRRKEGAGLLKFFCMALCPAHNKAYVLHSLAVVRATPNRGEKTAATSHKQNVVRKATNEVMLEN